MSQTHDNIILKNCQDLFRNFFEIFFTSTFFTVFTVLSSSKIFCTRAKYGGKCRIYIQSISMSADKKQQVKITLPVGNSASPMVGLQQKNRKQSLRFLIISNISVCQHIQFYLQKAIPKSSSQPSCLSNEPSPDSL